MIPSPIFVFGQPRSGTTLLQRLLNSTSQTLIYGEHMGILEGVASSYYHFFATPALGAFCAQPSPKEEFLAGTKSQLRDSGFFMAKINGLNTEIVKAAYRAFVQDVCNPIGFQPRWGFKEIRYGQTGDFVAFMLHDLFPTAQFVFLVRHPLQQISSLLGTGWWDISLDAAVFKWTEQVRSFRASQASMPDCSYLLRYEELISYPRRLFEWLDVPFSAAQEEILYKNMKVGATDRKLELTDAQRLDILARASPEINSLY